VDAAKDVKAPGVLDGELTGDAKAADQLAKISEDD